MNVRNHIMAALALCLVVAGLEASALADGPGKHPGLVAAKPESGRFVKTAKGYMVPYKKAIPGTKVVVEMVPIPGGTYKLGSATDESGRGLDEGPQVEIQVEPFWMGRYETTWEQYHVFMETYNIFKDRVSNQVKLVTRDNQVDAITSPTPLYEPGVTYMLGQDPRDPAVTMSQYGARQYTKWLSLLTGQFYRLPSEAEWEYACRAGTTTPFYFGKDASNIGDYAWYADNADGEYQNVGQKKPNAWGLHDMVGNVAELVIDQYHADAYKRFQSASSADAIMWPKDIFPQVIRGGAFDSEPVDMRSAKRSRNDDWREEDPNLPKSPWWLTDDPAMAVGFRIVEPLQAPSLKERRRFWSIYSDRLKQAVADRIQEGRGVYGLVDPELATELKETIGD